MFLGIAVGGEGRRTRLTYQTPGLFFVGSLQRLRTAVTRLNDWRIRKLEWNMGAKAGGPALRLAEISRQFGVTPDHLGRIFKQQVGLSFRDFAVQERLSHAAAKLLNTECSVKQAAAEAGYQHASDFSRKFKCLFGVTPQEFRRRRREQPHRELAQE